jgi:hypothetical protein
MVKNIQRTGAAQRVKIQSGPNSLKETREREDY